MCSQEAWGFTLPEGVGWHQVYTKPGGLLAIVANNCWFPTLCLVSGRFMLLFLCFVYVDLSMKEWKEDGNELKFWFIYLSHWGAMLELVYFLVLFLTTCLADCVCCPQSSGTTPWLVKITWLFGSMMPTVTLVIVIFHCALVYEESDDGPEGIHVEMHVFALIDLLFTAQPFYLKHVWVSVAVGVAYSAFSYIYSLSGGKTGSGSDYIYESLDWNDDPRTALAVVLVATFVATPLLHSLIWALVKIRQCMACGNEEATMAAWRETK